MSSSVTRGENNTCSAKHSPPRQDLSTAFPGLAVIRRASDSIQIVRVCYYLGPHAYRAPTPLTQYADEQVYTLLIYPY